MATALMGGVTTATVLTLFYLPAFYAASFKHSVRETAARRRLGAVPTTSAERSAEQIDLNAQRDTVRASTARLADTAVLFQVMGGMAVSENP
jgi:hypothetical protein